MKGLHCTVLRPVRDEEFERDFYPNGRPLSNLTDRVCHVTLCGKGVVELSEPSDLSPALVLVRRMLSDGEYLHAEPDTNGDRSSFGGNFVWTSDGRFPSKYPIPVHDRFETPLNRE
jgi:hypothetical protein